MLKWLGSKHFQQSETLNGKPCTTNRQVRLVMAFSILLLSKKTRQVSCFGFYQWRSHFLIISHFSVKFDFLAVPSTLSINSCISLYSFKVTWIFPFHSIATCTRNSILSISSKKRPKTVCLQIVIPLITFALLPE